MLGDVRQFSAGSSSPISQRPECPACGGGPQSDFFEMRDMPVNVGMLCDSLDEALRVPLADITLSYCHACGFIRNRCFDASRIAFRPGYHAELHYSPTMRSVVSDVVDGLIQRFELRGKRIVEVGCGDGHFLKLLCERGGNHGVGIDPTVANEGVESVGTGQVRFLRDKYREEHAELPCDFLCCRSVLEDIAQPAEFVRLLRNGLKNRRTGVYIEVFNALRSLERDEIWSIHYEQCNYFSQDSLNDLMERAGFEILNCGTSGNAGQYLFVEAVPGPLPVSANKPNRRSDAVLPTLLETMPATHCGRQASWRERLKSFQARDLQAVAWGTGGKGITFLNSFETRSRIPFVVDINPNRQHKFVPKSGQRTVAPEFLQHHRPDVVVITNALYEGEIRRQVSELGINCEFQCI